AQRLDPECERRLVHRHEPAGVERGEEEVVPALQHAPHGARVVRVGVAVLRELEEVEEGREAEDAREATQVPRCAQPLGERARRREGRDRLGTHGAAAGFGTIAATRPAPCQYERRTRQRPARSPAIVEARSTRESRSSIQSTGTSWIRSPFRSASNSSSVSKNQPSSTTCGSSLRATSVRRALKPHWASENPFRNARRRSALYPRESTSRLTWRRTCAEWALRVPIATSLCPER